MKQGETLALNERIMLSLVSTGVSKHLLFIFAENLFMRLLLDIYIIPFTVVHKNCAIHLTELLFD